MHDSQKEGKAKSGGKRIDDHSFWAGGKGKNAVMPDGVHTKSESSAEGEGSLMHYEDTSEQIKKQQEIGNQKIRSHPMKPNYRQ